MVDKYERVMVTGHRPQHLTKRESSFARSELNRLAEKLVDDHGMVAGISGMALGADTWWAHAVLDTADAELWAYIPFEHQPDRWREEEQKTWRSLRSLASREVVLGVEYDVKLLHARNDAMIRDSDLAIAVWKPSKETGGTASAVRKLKSLKRSVVIVDLDRFRTYRRDNND